MFDIDTGKLLIVAALALIVIGPKDLPRVLRQFGQSVGRLRRMASEFQGQFMDAIKDAEIEDIKKDLKDLEAKAELNYNFNPARDIQAEVTGAVNAVTSDASVDSPVKDFVLPEMTAGPETGEISFAEGIAPVADAQQAAVLDRLEEPVIAEERSKRKLFVKPHRSRFARLNADRTAQLTGQVISVRQRTVRARKPTSHDVLSS